MSRQLLRAVLAVLALASGARGVPAQEGSPAGAVPTEALEARRAALLERIGDGVAVLGTTRLRSIEGDYPQDSDFRQDNDFFYLTGLESPGAWLVAEGAGAAYTLYLPERDPAAEVWTGPRLGPGPEARGLTGIAAVRSVADFETDLASLLRATRPSSTSLYLSVGDPANAEAIERVAHEAGAEIDPLAPLMAELRLVKDADEIARLERAIEITAEAHRELWRVAEPGMHEYAFEAVVEYVFRVHGAERVGFPSIIGSGPNSTVLHYDRNRRETRPGDLVVVDVGAEFGYYSADITRTFPVSGRFTERQRRIYDLVLGAQRAALAEVRPGVTIAELTRVARDYIDRHSGDACGDAPCTRHFVHGLSHWLGMDVHDVGSYGTVLAPGMVLTVEPGIYLADEGLGVRIEDDVLVTADGHRLLSGALPREADEIEALMADEPRWVRSPER